MHSIKLPRSVWTDMVTLSGRTPYVPDDEQVEFAVEISDNAFALIMDEKRKANRSSKRCAGFFNR